jgi:hypothetical protein
MTVRSPTGSRILLGDGGCVVSIPDPDTGPSTSAWTEGTASIGWPRTFRTLHPMRPASARNTAVQTAVNALTTQSNDCPRPGRSLFLEPSV